MATANQLPTDDPIFARLQDQLFWYSQKSRQARKAFKRIKVIEIVAAALIPFLTEYISPGVISTIRGLAVLITVLEAILHFNHYEENWLSYGAVAESLKREKFMFLAKAGPYASASDPRVALAERIEAVMAQESTQWKAGVGS
ncbi:DUF4231 domain-containing protein [Acidicapsa acidisoli]|uniref:DUF4231 domain-containing protein n=1 Tax=Acidicapsa acidisoli TaxID=1615681 RepID=UPI0021E02327|nr:DUF4231 domain-containing protein [Acidicapsa acidisoli]